MKRLMMIALVLWPAVAVAQGLQIAPANDAELQGVLDKLAARHGKVAWCSGDCATFFEARFAGSLERGELKFELTGAVTGDAKAYVRLFGTRPSGSLDEALAGGGKRVPLYWSGDSYSAVLEPGEFRLTGTIKFPVRAPVTLKLPGPVGLVTLEVPDADVVGTGERRGVRDATYQLTPRERVTGKETVKEQLRLQVERRFFLARDRRFDVSLNAKGARPGQVIPIPLMTGEVVEDLDASVAHVRGEGASRVIEWVASGPTPSLTYGGKWNAESIELSAPTGTVKETWRVRCDDPLKCTFVGEAEKLTGETGHVWAPLGGQKLKVTWQELEPLAGVHTVAQDVALATHAVGRNLQQRLKVDWMSSSGSVVQLTLPAQAMISRFELDGTVVPILKDEKGVVQVSLPVGRSRLEADWELADGASAWLKPPVPAFSEPVGTLWHRVFPAEGASVLKTGGLDGSPRVALWPSLGACLVLAFVLVWLTRWGKAPLSSTAMGVVAVSGFAILHPAAALPLVLLLGLGRFLARIKKVRHNARIVLELAVWALLAVTAIGITFATLQYALFERDPMEVESFVSGGAIQAADAWGYSPLIWGTYLSGDPAAAKALPSPWVLCVPVLWVRLVWAAWAVAIAIFLVREGKLALTQLSAYWANAGWSRRPAKIA